MQINQNKTYYLSYNHQGSLKTITNTNNTIVKEITYNPYGKILNDTNKSLHVNINYAGSFIDKDTNLNGDFDENFNRLDNKHKSQIGKKFHRKVF